MSYISAQNPQLRATIVSNFLISELLASHAPVHDEPLYLISPWITNFALTLPIGSDISAILDSSEQTPRLLDAICQIAENGGKVLVAIQPESELVRANTFIKPLTSLAKSTPNLLLRQNPRLHAKIYVGKCGALHGSLNFTENGTSRNIEFSSFASDLRTIARLRTEAQAIFDASTPI